MAVVTGGGEVVVWTGGEVVVWTGGDERAGGYMAKE